MKSLREKSNKGRISTLFSKLKSVKNIEIIIAAVLAFVAILLYFGISFSGSRKSTVGATSVSASSSMSTDEKRLAETISRIEGVGECTTFIKIGANKEAVGVIVVAEGANDVKKRVEIIRCVEIATGVTVDKIQVYQMENGG